jgi:YesN/AraC family two-component response regulator
MSMPHMTGEDLAKELLRIRPNIPIIISTGFSERFNEEDAKALGIKGFLMKPVIKSDMAKEIRRVLD